MDLLKTLLVYMTMVYASSVQSMPEPEAYMASILTPTPVVTATPAPTPKPTAVPTVAVSVNPEYGVVQMGDKGDEVLRLQETLAQYGYYDGELDGRFGRQTRQAVERFQYCHGLYADGIAGRNTLSVLYDSDGVRPADTWESVSPAPAETPAPTPSPSPSPTATPSPSPTPTLAPATPSSQEEAAVLEPREGWSLSCAGQTVADGRNEALPPCYLGEKLYLPLEQLLRAQGITLLPSDGADTPGFAFALSGGLYRVAYGLDQSGAPVNLEIMLNGARQLLKTRDVQAWNGALYLPAETLEELLGLQVETDEGAGVVRVDFPTANNG